MEFPQVLLVTIIIQKKVHFLYAKNLSAELPGYGLVYTVTLFKIFKFWSGGGVHQVNCVAQRSWRGGTRNSRVMCPLLREAWKQKNVFSIIFILHTFGLCHETLEYKSLENFQLYSSSPLHPLDNILSHHHFSQAGD